MSKSHPAKPVNAPCPCGRFGESAAFEQCCGRWLAQQSAPDPESLMRSRYSAFVREDAAYLLATWHPSTRPETLSFTDDDHCTWLGLSIKKTSTNSVEFVARYKIGGRAFRIHETSRFVLEQDHWFYVDGDVH